VLTRTTGAWSSDGEKFEATAVVTSTIKGSVQPVSGYDLQILPEGLRSEKVLKIYTSRDVARKIVTADQGTPAQLPDVITYDGVDYLVYSVRDWKTSMMKSVKHYRIICYSKGSDG